MARDLTQDMLDQARHDGVLELEADVYRVSRGLVIEDINGFTVRGKGPYATELRWTSPHRGTLLTLRDTTSCRIERLSITPDPGRHIRTAIAIVQSTDNVRDSTRCVVDSVRIRGGGESAITWGIHVRYEDEDVKNDHHRFRDVTVADVTHAAFALDGHNAKGIVFDGCLVQNWDGANDKPGGVGVWTGERRGLLVKENGEVVKVGPGGGAFHWFGGTMTGCRRCFRLDDRNDPITITGLYSEKCLRFLTSHANPAGKAPIRFPITISGVNFSTNCAVSSGKVIDYDGLGPLIIRGSSWEFTKRDPDTGVPLPYHLKFVIPDLAADTTIFEGNSIRATNYQDPLNDLPSLFPVGMPAHERANLALQMLQP